MRDTLVQSTYHSVLRIAVLLFAFILVFDSGLISESTTNLSNGAQNYVANAVGVKVAVAPNDMNVLTARITELEQELAVKDREIAVARMEPNERETLDTSTFVLSVILFILLILILLNYTLDYLRSTIPVVRNTSVTQ